MSVHSVLVVEDQLEQAQLVRKKLTAEGFRCTTVADGTQAWTVATRDRPDAIVLDLMLLGEHGLVFLGRLRNDAVLCRTKVIITTAWTNVQARAEAQRLGVDAYLEKPFALETLVKTLRHLLDAAPHDGASGQSPPDATGAGGRVSP